VNTEILIQTKEWLLAGAPGYNFDMSVIYDHTDCGTTCCIGGYIAKALDPSFDGFDALWVAENLLDLPPGVANALFYPDEGFDGQYLKLPEGRFYSNITTQEAAQAVQNVIDHQDPRWLEVLSA